MDSINQKQTQTEFDENKPGAAAVKVARIDISLARRFETVKIGRILADAVSLANLLGEFNIPPDPIINGLRSEISRGGL